MAQRSLKTVTAVGRIVLVEKGFGCGGAVVFGETAGQDLGGVGQSVTLQCCAVAAAAFGGAGGASAVDVGDAPVSEVDEVVDGFAEAGGVVGADDIDGVVPHRPCNDDDRHRGDEVAQVGRRLVAGRAGSGPHTGRGAGW